MSEIYFNESKVSKEHLFFALTLRRVHQSSEVHYLESHKLQ